MINIINGIIDKLGEHETKNVNEIVEVNSIEVKNDRELNESIDISLYDDIEKTLDSKIHRYNKYTNKNPMLYVDYNEKKKMYRFRYDNISKKSKDKQNIINMAITKITGDNLTNKITKIVPIKIIKYHNYDIVVYENYIFDINHIIDILKYNHNEEFKETYYVDYKYNHSKNYISHYGFKENEYGGYIVKEFITEEKMYQLVLSSDSDFSKKFKLDISKILVKLRENGLIEVNNDSIELESILNSQVNSFNNITTEISNNKIPERYRYTNMEHHYYILNIVRNGLNIAFSEYIECHTMYMFILSLFNDDMNIICKIGYTYDIIARYKSLMYEYKCMIFLVSLKSIKSEHNEKELHKLIKNVYPNLTYHLTIGSTNKEELYYFNPVILNEFMKSPEYSKNKFKNEDVEANQMLRNQVAMFIQNTLKFQFIDILG